MPISRLLLLVLRLVVWPDWVDRINNLPLRLLSKLVQHTTDKRLLRPLLRKYSDSKALQSVSI